MILKKNLYCLDDILACGGSMFDVSGEIELDSNNVHDNEV